MVTKYLFSIKVKSFTVSKGFWRLSNSILAFLKLPAGGNLKCIYLLILDLAGLGIPSMLCMLAMLARLFSLWMVRYSQTLNTIYLLKIGDKKPICLAISASRSAFSSVSVLFPTWINSPLIPPHPPFLGSASQ